MRVRRENWRLQKELRQSKRALKRAADWVCAERNKNTRLQAQLTTMRQGICINLCGEPQYQILHDDQEKQLQEQEQEEEEYKTEMTAAVSMEVEQVEEQDGGQAVDGSEAVDMII